MPLLPSGNFACAGDLIGLRSFLALDDIELDIIPFFQAFVTVKLNRAVVNEYIRAIITPNEAIAFCIVEPLHFAFVRCHEPWTFLKRIAVGNTNVLEDRDASKAALVFLRKREGYGSTKNQ